MNTWDYIERVRALNGGEHCSDYRIAKLLDIAQPTISSYRARRREADDETAAKIADLLEMHPLHVMADIRASRPDFEDNARMAALWREILDQYKDVVVPRPIPKIAHIKAAPMTAPAMTKTPRRYGVAASRKVVSIWDGMSLKMVAKDGIEPPTRGFSIPCSTD